MRRSNIGPATGAESGDPDYDWVIRNTGSVGDMIQRDVDNDPEFREVLPREALDLIRAGDVETGRSILEDYFAAWPETDVAKPASAEVGE